MFGLNEYSIALVLSVVILGLWIVSFVLAEIWKYTWAWVDDGKPGRGNFIINKLTKTIKSKWIYPVYNGKSKKADGEIFGYAKDEKLKDTHDIYGLKEGIDYKYSWRYGCQTIRNISFKTIILTVPIPFFVLFCIKLYTIVFIAGSILLIAHLARFTRRLSKKYNLHASNKDIHIKPKKKK